LALRTADRIAGEIHSSADRPDISSAGLGGTGGWALQ